MTSASSRLDQLDLALEDDKEGAVVIALLAEDGAGGHLPHLAMLMQHGDLLLRQLPECFARDTLRQIISHHCAPTGRHPL